MKKLRGYQSRPTDNSQRKNIPQKASNVWIKAKKENNSDPKKVEKGGKEAVDKVENEITSDGQTKIINSIFPPAIPNSQKNSTVK